MTYKYGDIKQTLKKRSIICFENLWKRYATNVDFKKILRYFLKLSYKSFERNVELK